MNTTGIESLLRDSVTSLGPQMERVNRALEVAMKSEIKTWLRENGVSVEWMTDKEYDEFIVLLDNHKTNGQPLQKFCKDYVFRQAKRLHNPQITAEYLKTSYKDTLVYFFFFVLYLTLIYTTCRRMPWLLCIAIRLCMTAHLGYYNYLWLLRILTIFVHHTKVLYRITTTILKVIPLIAWELGQLLFEIFLGWTLLFSILGIITVLYIMPIIFPEMALSSVFVDIYRAITKSDAIPMPLYVVTLFL